MSHETSNTLSSVLFGLSSVHRADYTQTDTSEIFSNISSESEKPYDLEHLFSLLSQCDSQSDNTIEPSSQFLGKIMGNADDGQLNIMILNPSEDEILPGEMSNIVLLRKNQNGVTSLQASQEMASQGYEIKNINIFSQSGHIKETLHIDNVKISAFTAKDLLILSHFLIAIFAMQMAKKRLEDQKKADDDKKRAEEAKLQESKVKFHSPEIKNQNSNSQLPDPSPPIFTVSLSKILNTIITKNMIEQRKEEQTKEEEKKFIENSILIVNTEIRNNERRKQDLKVEERRLF